MAYSDDHIVLAAEFALGTLDAEERAQVQTMMAVDKDFAAICALWEFRLGVLNQMVGLVEPRAELWQRIKAATQKPETIDAVGAVAAETEVAEEVAVPEQQAPSVMPGRPSLAADIPDIAQLAARARQWRAVANGMTGLAAVLLAVMAVQVFRPDLLPGLLRARQVKAPAAAQLVALLQKDGEAPAFVLSFEAGSRTFTVRRMEAAPEPGKGYELWLMSDRLPQPLSLGVIGGGDFTSTSAPTSLDADTILGATYGVSVEVEGGSPSGVASGPIVYSGRLIAIVPAADAPR